MDRRTSLKLLALSPLPIVIGGCTLTGEDLEHAHEAAAVATAQGDGTRAFFTDPEFETVTVLADLIIPADDRSGSASDVGVPLFMDFIMRDFPTMQVPMRGGLAWLDAHTRRRVGRTFLEATDAERRSVLDEIAYKKEDVEPDLPHGVAFFNRFRDLTASGFWSSKEGMDDLQYLGNRVVPQWTGPPQEELDRLGLSFDAWETV